ncbi:MFS transporter [Desulfohalovibrio reitneri]|uniref:MFS transporter n=1 Tax=Desulfohalovibrio reitneri TaxID=1307759 RepID=UPI0004A6BC24|nr:MFS transporter [Desulfohalovibrio reitneri]
MRDKTAWCIYDWANSAYVLTTATAVLPAYFAAQVAPEGAVLFGVQVSPTSLWGAAVGLSALLVFVSAAVLGAVADLSGRAGLFWRVFCAIGSLSAIALSFSGPGDWLSCLLLFGLAQFGFACGNVFYDAFLPVVAKRDEYDQVSGSGFAWGYAGGGLHFALCLGLVSFAPQLGLDKARASQIAMASSGVWWGLFAIIPLSRLRDPRKPSGMAPRDYLREGARRTLGTLRTFTKGGPAASFLLAFLLYNDGIQTTITMATIYGKQELGLPLSTLMLTLLIIQAVALAGAHLFSRLAGRTTTKTALVISLFIWTGAAVFGYFITTAWQYMLLGCLVGLSLGGSQALSRSLFARLTPDDQRAQYFGYFSVVNKLSAIGGPIVFAAVRFATGSSRPAVLAVAAFFIGGMLLLRRVRVDDEEKSGA